MAADTLTTEYDAHPYELDMVWLDSPFLEHLLQESGLSEAEQALVRQFATDGYTVIDPEIPEEVIDAVNQDLAPRFQELLDNPDLSESVGNRIQDAWKFSTNVKQLVAAPKVLSTLKLLYRRNPIPFQTLNFRVGTEQMTHSDTVHFQSYPANFMCGVWVALEDVSAINGAVHYYPGSHRLPLFDLNTLGIDNQGRHSYQSYEIFVQKMLENSPYKQQIISLKKGQALIWSANLFHGGSPILDTSRTRLSQVTHYYFEGCMYYTPGMSNPFMGRIAWRNDLTDIRTGQPIPMYHRGEKVDMDTLRPETIQQATIRTLISSAVKKGVNKLKPANK